MNDTTNAMTLLKKGLAELQISLSPEPLMTYLTLLNKWNRTYNLTAVRDLDSMVTRHLLDSLAILPWIDSGRLLDVGSGAGFPGIPLALAHPNLEVVVLDSNGKKIRFMQEAKRVLGLDNLEVVQARVETYQPEQKFDTVTSRAFSDLQQMISWTKHLITTSGKWLAMKGRYPETELATINYPYEVKTYTVPGLTGERCCVLIENLN
jgi:16S rRNA (guanine527-N7)-methyltransferase